MSISIERAMYGTPEAFYAVAITRYYPLNINLEDAIAFWDKINGR